MKRCEQEKNRAALSGLLLTTVVCMVSVGVAVVCTPSVRLKEDPKINSTPAVNSHRLTFFGRKAYVEASKIGEKMPRFSDAPPCPSNLSHFVAYTKSVQEQRRDISFSLLIS